MKKVFAIVLALVMLLTLSGTTVFAGIGSEIPDTGKHWTLNVIGVQNPKNVDFDINTVQSNGSTIFVPLDPEGEVPQYVKINYVLNTDDPTKFKVVDRDATDDGEATIAVPYSLYNETTNPAPDLSFNVYAVGLGKPGNNAKAEGEAILIYTEKVRGKKTGTAGDEVAPGDPIPMGSIEVERPKGNKGVQKPTVVDITDVFRVSGWIDENGDGVKDPGEVWFDDVWCFNVPYFGEYYWEFGTSDGGIPTSGGWNLKHMQVRFYETTSGSWGTY